jgi:hypothetical protein
MGVAALERVFCDGSPKAASRKCEAGTTAASEGSHACSESLAATRSWPWSMFWPMERKRTSRASWVRPRWVLDPRIVCVCAGQHPYSPTILPS